MEVLKQAGWEGQHSTHGIVYQITHATMCCAFPQAARGVLAQMQAEGQHPTAVTFNALLRGYAARGRAGRSVRLLPACIHPMFASVRGIVCCMSPSCGRTAGLP